MIVVEAISSLERFSWNELLTICQIHVSYSHQGGWGGGNCLGTMANLTQHISLLG